MSDRGGPLRPFVVGSVLFAAGLLVAGIAPAMPCVVAGRVAQGFGAGALSSIAYVAVARGYDASCQPRMLALFASAWVVPGLIGPAAAAAIATLLGWRAVFLLLVPMTALASTLAAKGLRRLEPAPRAAPMEQPMVPALRLAGGVALALVAGGSGSLAVTVAGIAAGAAVGWPALARLFPEGTMRAAPGAPAALAAKTLVTFAFFGCEAFLPFALTVVRGQSIAVAGVVLTAGTLSWTSGTWIQERLAGRAERGLLACIGLAVVAAAIAGSAAVLVWPAPAVVATLAWAAAGLGIGIAYPATTLIVFEQMAGGEEGAAAAALQLANVLGIAAGTGTGGAVLAAAAIGGVAQGTAIAAIDALMLAAALAGLVAAARCGVSAATAQGAAVRDG